MSDKVFFDTNVLVYCYTETEPEKSGLLWSLPKALRHG